MRGVEPTTRVLEFRVGFLIFGLERLFSARFHIFRLNPINSWPLLECIELR